MTNVRQTEPSHFWIGEDEEKALTINVGNWFSAPTQASLVVKVGASDVTACVLQSSGCGGATISGSLVTTPCFLNLTAGCSYRCELLIQQGGEVLECYFHLTGAS